MQLSELRPEAIRLIIRLIRRAEERMNEDVADSLQTSGGTMENETYENMDKTPKCFPKSNDL
jgi:hypothetical protein